MLSRASCLVLAFIATGCLQNHELFQEVAPRHNVGEPCATDEDCVTSLICSDEVCTACPEFMRCRQGFSALQRNGCTWCAPRNDCTSDEECGSGMVCYAGQQCPPGCNDPSCCFGNLCSDPSCPPPPNLDCSLSGCADGSNCVGTGQVGGCACDPSMHTWSCMMQDGAANQCDHFRGPGGEQGGGGPPGGGGRM